MSYRESLRDIEVCPRAQHSKLYHIGIRGRVSRATLADANEDRDWCIYADFAEGSIRIARPLYAEDSFGVDLDETVYALDATTIDLCLSVFPRAPFQRAKAAVKLHTLLDLRGNIPAFIHISGARWYDVPDGTTSRCSTNSSSSPAPSMSWTAAISISHASIRTPAGTQSRRFSA